MSLKIPSVSLTPSTVYTGAQFIVSIEVYDDAFEFGTVPVIYDNHQGFANIEQTIGGKLQ